MKRFLCSEHERPLEAAAIHVVMCAAMGFARCSFNLSRRFFHVLLTSVLLACACASSSNTELGKPSGPDEALYRRALTDLEDGLYPEALKGFADIKAKYPYSAFAALADLRTADTHFERGRFLEAIDSYRRFLKFHPNHAEGAYAMLRIGESYYEQLPSDWWFLPPSAEKDQGNVRLAITAFRDMTARYDDHELTSKAQERIDACRGRLADHEMYVARFYFDRERYRAALGRAEGLLKSYQGLGYDAEALWISAKSYFELGNRREAQQALARLTQEHPDSENFEKATQLLQRLGQNTASPQEPKPREKGKK